MEKPNLSSFSLDGEALSIAIEAGDEYCQHTAKPPRLAYAAAIRAYLREIAALDHQMAASANLLASLDPDTLNPEQFNAWSKLSEATGYRP
jgi:hypothetical protein